MPSEGSVVVFSNSRIIVRLEISDRVDFHIADMYNENVTGSSACPGWTRCKADDRQDGVFLNFTWKAPGHLTAYCVRETAILVVSRFCLEVAYETLYTFCAN